MIPITNETIDEAIDRVLDFLDVQRGNPGLPDAPLEAHFASHGMAGEAFTHLNQGIEARVFPTGPSTDIVNALHGGALLGVAIGLAIAERRAERSDP
ncbi:hypothetical protein OJ997_22480 [Solirubrobacter phytolaccae]|uniref:Uncharacterized protein n=1 Tax=Solirubrobacter phytolaccae TaxID=1404360 RepID=A0A9X3S9Y8_9ACTN|nr:hypothetical protein [Solirubrobacter phytolaccae]MDA0183093.1 hypothetical protein [Solirubrobacter phytolaccae]